MHGRSPARAGNGIAKPLKGAPQFAARGCIYCVSNLSGSLAGAGGGSPTIRGPASMQQVAEWLEKLGLAQYAQRFAENDISFQFCPISRINTLKRSGCR
jgi:SAM domain (Sterile alpha motif)